MITDNSDIKVDDNHFDDRVEEEIKTCILKDNLRSFFLFAGAGSGKTRSLINTLSYVDHMYRNNLTIHYRKVAVITYTNAACDEISKRLNYKSLFKISTIHSFLWDLIKPYQIDIKNWMINSINQDIEKLTQEIDRSKKENTIRSKQKKLNKKQERLQKVNDVNKFSYNPNGENFEYNSLNHSEVLKMGAQFISQEKTMQNILVQKYPFLFIDESQDTNKELIDALLLVEKNNKNKFLIGMFGDTMQRIYLDGKPDLPSCIPPDWSKPEKVMNHRSSKRIVALANTVRLQIDGQKQRARSDVDPGIVRLYIADNTSNKQCTEHLVRKRMKTITSDEKWIEDSEHKTLILEHQMAANRFDFSELFTPINDSKKFDTSLRDGSIPELSFLSDIVSPLVNAYNEQNNYEITKILRKHSPLYKKESFLKNKSCQQLLLKEIKESTYSLFSLWDNKKTPTCLEVLKNIDKTNLFELSSRAKDIISTTENEPKIIALKNALNVPFDKLERYSNYVSNNTQYATHQGVKGLEFPRVMIVLDDSEAKGNLFSYEKLFGAKPLSKTDIQNEEAGKDTGIARTSRLFYVACTRAKKSLAVVAYTSDKNAVKQTALKNNWFLDSEIEIINPEDNEKNLVK